MQLHLEAGDDIGLIYPDRVHVFNVGELGYPIVSTRPRLPQKTKVTVMLSASRPVQGLPSTKKNGSASCRTCTYCRRKKVRNLDIRPTDPSSVLFWLTRYVRSSVMVNAQPA